MHVRNIVRIVPSTDNNAANEAHEMKISDELFDEAFRAAQADELAGFCVACGEQFDGLLEPDARNVHCESCGEDQVFGAEEIMLMGA